MDNFLVGISSIATLSMAWQTWKIHRQNKKFKEIDLKIKRLDEIRMAFETFSAAMAEKELYEKTIQELKEYISRGVEDIEKKKELTDAERNKDYVENQLREFSKKAQSLGQLISIFKDDKLNAVVDTFENAKNDKERKKMARIIILSVLMIQDELIKESS